MTPKATVSVDTKLLRAALVGLEGRFEHAQSAKAQIEAEFEHSSVEGSVYEEPELALGVILEDIFEILLVVTEAAGLARTRSRLIRQWKLATLTHKSGAGTYDRQFEIF